MISFWGPPDNAGWPSVDLDGDGTTDNGYFFLESALPTDLLIADNMILGASPKAGQHLLLIEWTSADPTFNADACAQLTVYHALPQANSDFSGAGTFTIDSTFAPVVFKGPITKGLMLSESPATTAEPRSLDIDIAVGQVLVHVPLVGVSIQLDENGALGFIDGAMRETDVRTVLVPPVAAAWTARVKPPLNLTTTGEELTTLVDTGGTKNPVCANGCQNADGTCALPNDHKIDECEIMTSGYVGMALQPDVRMFAPDGSYRPSPGSSGNGDLGTVPKDSWAVGVQFDAVKATF